MPQQLHMVSCTTFCTLLKAGKVRLPRCWIPFDPWTVGIWEPSTCDFIAAGLMQPSTSLCVGLPLASKGSRGQTDYCPDASSARSEHAILRPVGIQGFSSKLGCDSSSGWNDSF